MTDRTLGGADLDAVADWMRSASAITVLTGAGISTDSGIPDFRGPQGVWTRDPQAQRLSDLKSYVADPQLRRRAWLGRRDHIAWHARPNSGHQALVELQRTGRLRAVITQNIDELHQRAGTDPELVIELHGTIFGVQCLSCRERTTMESALARVSAGEEDPACLRCGGILKSATVSFGQELDQSVLKRARFAAADCDLFLAVGSSLTVHPAAGLVTVAASAGAKVVVLNGQPTPYDATADAVLRGPIGDLLPALVTPPEVQMLRNATPGPPGRSEVGGVVPAEQGEDLVGWRKAGHQDVGEGYRDGGHQYPCRALQDRPAEQGADADAHHHGGEDRGDSGAYPGGPHLEAADRNRPADGERHQRQAAEERRRELRHPDPGDAARGDGRDRSTPCIDEELAGGSGSAFRLPVLPASLR